MVWAHHPASKQLRCALALQVRQGRIIYQRILTWIINKISRTILHFGLATNKNALYTFSFQVLLHFAVFSIISARERQRFCATMPSKILLAALAADVLLGTVLTVVDLPGLAPLPWWQTLAAFGYAMVSCLVVNDAVKVVMIKRHVSPAVG